MEFYCNTLEAQKWNSRQSFHKYVILFEQDAYAEVQEIARKKILRSSTVIRLKFTTANEIK